MIAKTLFAMKNPLAIRTANPKDAGFIAWAILTATRSHLSKGWFDIALAQPESECLHFISMLTTTTVLSQWHYSRFLIAEEGVTPVSAVAAFRAGDAYPVSTSALVETIKKLELPSKAAEAIWQRGAYMFLCTMRPNDERWVVENLATIPERRGCGCTPILLSRALDNGRNSGFKEAQITLFIGNERAERAYHKVGFLPDKEKRHPTFEAMTGTAGLRQYRKIL